MNSPKCCNCEYVVDAFGKQVECKKTAENGKFDIWYYWNDGAPPECPLNTEKEEVKMTADERIEILLNRFGQTISDLPNGRDYMHKDKLIMSMKNADAQAFDWFNPELRGEFDYFGLHAYICHLADVIDRMETALETAALAIDCGQCQYWDVDDCGGKCKEIARIADYQLAGMTEREFEDFVKGEEHTDA